MIVVGILGDIGSGKSFVAKQFGCPVFNADYEVNKIYKKNKVCFLKLKAKLPKFIKSFPLDKNDLTNAILSNKKNLGKIISIVHPLVRSRMNIFLKKNINRKMVVLDIPLLVENKLDRKEYVLVYVDSKKKQIYSRLKKRGNYNKRLLDIFKKIQKPLSLKKKLSSFIIKNDFKPQTVKKNIKILRRKILNK